MIERKIILYRDSYFIEEYRGDTIFNKKTYHAFSQLWEDGHEAFVYLREEDGRILEYEDFTTNETVRYDEFFEPGHKWISERELPFTLLGYNTSLTTPYCDYTGLMSIKADYDDGGYYIFYYKKGIGYVGSTDENGNLISCMAPFE